MKEDTVSAFYDRRYYWQPMESNLISDTLCHPSIGPADHEAAINDSHSIRMAKCTHGQPGRFQTSIMTVAHQILEIYLELTSLRQF